jgi:hypothetical protein
MADKESLTMKSARMRIRASFIGCLIAGIYLYFFPFTVCYLHSDRRAALPHSTYFRPY